MQYIFRFQQKCTVTEMTSLNFLAKQKTTPSG